MAAYANILWLLFIANDFVPVSLLKGLVEETASEFQLVRCALFLVRSEVCGVDELIRVRLTFGILKLFLAVSSLVCVETQAYQDSTERGRKGRQLELGEQVWVIRQNSPSAKKSTLGRTPQNSHTHLRHHHKRVSLTLLLSYSHSYSHS